MKIYRTSYNYQIIQNNKLYNMDISMHNFKYVCIISDAYTPSGRLLNAPSKKLIYHIQNQIKKNDNSIQH